MRNPCRIDGCSNYIELDVAVNFLCREHSDFAPDEVRFQECQFSEELPRGVDYFVEWQSLDEPAAPPTGLSTIRRDVRYVDTRSPLIDREQDDISDATE